MKLSQPICLMASAITVVAAVPFGWGNENAKQPWWTPSSASSYLDFTKRVASAAAGTCDVSNAVMPTAPTPLPSPGPGMSLYHVAIGRGTQNYTCDTTNSSAIPVAVGANATLFNVTCLAASSPELLAVLPGIALNLDLPSTSDQNSPAYQDMSGHHFFTTLTTAFFDLDTTLHQYGAGAFKKVSTSNAPAGAVVGPNGVGNGAVAWLKLNATDDVDRTFLNVYRLNTAGGSPPKTCAGMPKEFYVPYAAEYWMWRNVTAEETASS